MFSPRQFFALVVIALILVNHGLTSKMDTEKAKEVISKVFSLADKNKDGQLTKQEAREGDKKLAAGLAGGNEKKRMAMFKDADKDNDDQISKKEWDSFSGKLVKFVKSFATMKKDFKKVDKNEDDNVSKGEIKKVLISRARKAGLSPKVSTSK